MKDGSLLLKEEWMRRQVPILGKVHESAPPATVAWAITASKEDIFDRNSKHAELAALSDIVPYVKGRTHEFVRHNTHTRSHTQTHTHTHMMDRRGPGRHPHSE
eukprot:3696150-Prymnesium_polylepis.1